MVLISTPFLTYREIKTEDNDILEDAFDLRGEFPDVYQFLGTAICKKPEDQLIEKLIRVISEKKQRSATG